MNMSARVAILTFILVMGMVVCSAGILSPEMVNFTGTVNYIDLEGGFWGIVAADGKKYDPLNLPMEFKKEGLRVHVEGVVKNVIGIHMWGTVIEITVINKEDIHGE
ncbi:MAG: hypothetical protein AB9895_01065 [Negativicutes bacterium]